MPINKKYIIITGLSAVFIITIIAIFMTQKETPEINNNAAEELNENSYFDLPPIKTDGTMSLEQAILQRRSVRNYKDEPISLEAAAQILWSAQGITEPTRGFRASPSAGALYPLSLYLVSGNVQGLAPGIYRYLPEKNSLRLVKEGDLREALYQNALYQDSVRQAALIVIIAADYNITSARYGHRSERYVHMEVGHAGQNIYLQATALNLGTVAIGAFDEQAVKNISKIRDNEIPLYLMPIGPK